MAHIEVTRDESTQRFVAWEDGRKVGLIAYDEREGVLDLHHTEVDPARQGQGIAGALVRQVLDQISAAGEQVIPTCSYVHTWIERHPDYASLVAQPGDGDGVQDH